MSTNSTQRSQAAQELHDRLLTLIRDGLAEKRLSHRALERLLGYGHGTIGKLVAGKSDLRFRHLDEIGAVLGFTLHDALVVGLGGSLSQETVSLEDQFADRVAQRIVASLNPAGDCTCDRSTRGDVPV